MKIIVTGTSSGIGENLTRALHDHEVIALSRKQLDLSDVGAVENFQFDPVDMLVNCAGTDLGGKIDFVNHRISEVVSIINTNLLAPMLLAHRALLNNSHCKIVNITSTNNKRYYANNLAYSLSKKSLSDFGKMLSVDYPDLRLLEIQLGLTRTNFNQNRYRTAPKRFRDIYQQEHLTAEQATERIISVLFDDTIKFIEIGP